MFSDADAAALYDVLNPWDPDGRPDDGFYFPFVMGVESVLDVGCGTGAMLRLARERGHRGRLVGLAPDRAALDRARRRSDITWVEGTAAQAPSGAGFALATMTGHGFQCLITDHDVRSSLAAIHDALRPGGRFLFDTRHPQARAWENWTPANPDDMVEIVDATGRPLRYGHQVDSVVGDVVTLRGTVAQPDGTVLRVLHDDLRFLDVASLGRFLAAAGFDIEAQYGDWNREPITTSSREIITVARRRSGAADSWAPAPAETAESACS
ncbi:class I SAM-dependent methyltransferase [Streptomyces sp. A1-5]|uniref:class I SAM-dependent methyltransferase n=1 Tax=Streptomyces sp. A1-5 TaxID=2738410 RepID=UPI001F401B9F|nr:class I SAM-dependent methyltransferase [Streptomyces sp. A1-5]UJB46018.1 methyltransferase domain-containing protein [Streptomyces sp. A1-5]